MIYIHSNPFFYQNITSVFVLYMLTCAPFIHCRSVVISVDSEMMTAFFVFMLIVCCQSLEGSPAVGVVGGEVNINIIISDRSISSSRYVSDPKGLQIIQFYTGFADAGYTDTNVNYTGNITGGFMSFTLSKLTSGRAGIYQYFISKGVTGFVIAGEQNLVIAGIPTRPVITTLSEQAVAGGEHKLNCSAVSTSVKPGHNLIMFSEWKRNGSNIMSDDPKYDVTETILTIRNLSKTDNNVSLTCIAFEDQRVKSLDSTAFPLNVYYGPDSITLYPSQMSYDLVENSSLNVNCLADCVPSCQYRWTGPGVNYTDETGMLSISKISRSQTGVFTCTASNPGITSNSATVTVSVTVKYGPDSITLSPSQMSYDLVENSSLNVNCSADCVPSCQYRWTGPGGNYSNKTGILSISKIRRSQAGLCTCTAFNPNITSNSATATVSVTVQYGPDSIILIPKSTVFEMVENSSLSVNCSADCVPSCHYNWTGPGESFPQEKAILAISSIKRDQAGVFKCRATNTKLPSNIATASLSIIVYYPPVVSIKSQNGTYNDTNIVLTCTAHGVPEQYVFTLTHSSLFTSTVIRHPSFDHVSSGVIRYQFSSYMDTGIYTCTVNNGIADYKDGSVNKSLYEAVWIKGPPIVTSSDINFYAEEGQCGKLSLEFYNSLLDPNITWYRDKNQTLEKLDSSDKYSISISVASVTLSFYSVSLVQPGFSAALEIRNVTTDDFGSYQVIVQNSVGVMSPRMFNLRARGPPDAPYDVRIVPNSITSSSVAVEWLSGFHGGSNQTFVIEYRKLTDTAWTKFSLKVFGGMTQDQYFNITVGGLYQATMYLFRMYAWNSRNISEFSLVINATTTAVPDETSPSQISAVAGGVAGAIVAVILLVGISILIWRRYQHKKSVKGQMYENATHFDGSSNKENVYEGLSNTSGENAYDSLGAPNGTCVENDSLMYVNLKLKPLTNKNGEPNIHRQNRQTEAAQTNDGRMGESL